MRGFKRQQAAALTHFVGCFLLALLFLFSLLSALNDLPGPSAGPLARITYSIFHSTCFFFFIEIVTQDKGKSCV